ncbi:MAG: SH3 domain-containing protein, partial [Desulfitobacteriaceae bacterium]|nr:SH3 domain-containing protein [Desulfitobacteriaceae bacterium]
MNLRGTPFLQFVISLFFGVLFLISACPVLAETTVQVKTEILNVRSGPDTSFDRIGQVKMGERYIVCGKENGWLKIELSGGKAGWISDNYVDKLPEEQSAPQKEEKPAGEIIVTGDQVNVRSGPDTSFSKISSLEKGTRLPLLLHEKGWYQVKLASGNTGWVADWLAEPAPGKETPTDLEPSSSEPLTSTVIATASTLNVRNAPSLDAGKIGTVTKGTRMNLVSRSGDWYQVEM